MARYRYPRFVDKNSIFTITDKDNERRYVLRIRLKGKGKESLLVIIKNMGAADELDCDGKVYRILKYVYQSHDLMDIGEVIIMSLFPLCCCKSNHIIQKLYEKGPDFISGNDNLFIDEGRTIQNRQLLKEYIFNTDKIILAWGTPVNVLQKFFKDNADYVINLLRKSQRLNSTQQIYTVGEKNITGHPKSCLSWGYKDTLNKY